jgi:hypothetical protein
MDKEELRKRMSNAIGTFENRMVYNISNDCAEIALKYFTEQLNKPLVGGPASVSALEGEQLPAEGQGEANTCAWPCPMCRAMTINTNYEGYCCQSCFDGA